MILQAILAGFVLATSLVAFSLAVAAAITFTMDRQEPFKTEYARRKGNRQ